MASLAFSGGFEATVFGLTYFVWVLSEFIGANIIPRLRRRGQTGTRRDRGSVLLIVFTIFISIAVAFNFGMVGIGLLPDWAFYLGILISILGIIIRQYAIAVLGRFFSLSVRVAEDHRIVDSGPYRYVRHPSYTGALLTLIGLGLAVQSWPAVVALVAMFAFSYGYRMRVEERALTLQLGQDYVSYMKRTKRLFPFLI